MAVTLFGRGFVEIQVGDKFVKTDDRLGWVWTVSRLWTAVDGIAHARLNGPENESMTIVVSVATLNNQDFFVRP